MKRSTKLTLFSLCTGAIASLALMQATMSDNKIIRSAAAPVGGASTLVCFSVLTLAILTKEKQLDRTPEESEPIAIKPAPPPPIAASVPPICQNCEWLGAHWQTGHPHCSYKGKFTTEDDGWNCQDFGPVYPASALLCSYKPPVLEGIRDQRERELQAALERPIQVRLTQSWDGSRDVAIAPPWGDFAEGAYDITLGDGPECQVNTEGGIRLAATGHEDYYCNVGARETKLFAWEVSLAAAIAESPDSFEEFWADPQAFIEAFPNPNNYNIKLIGLNKLQSWEREEDD